MTLPLQNFVDKVGPAVSAAWLNELDQKRAVMSQPGGAGTNIFGLSKTAVKAVSTPRSNTNTPAADPDLQWAGCEPGTYRVQAFLQIFATTTTTQGLLLTLGSTAGTGNGYLVGVGIINNAANPYFFQQGAGAGPVAFTNINTAITDFLLIDAVVSPTVSGVISINWSQRASGANATNLNAQSWATLTRLS